MAFRSWRASSKTSLIDWMWNNLTTDCGFLCLWLEIVGGILLFWGFRGTYWKIVQWAPKTLKAKLHFLSIFSTLNWFNECTEHNPGSFGKRYFCAWSPKSSPVFLLHHSWHFYATVYSFIILESSLQLFLGMECMQCYVIYVFSENVDNAMIIFFFSGA